MFKIELHDENVVVVEGRLDAASAPRAQEVLDQVEDRCSIDMVKLEYISSAGLGVLSRTHKRMMAAGESLRLVGVGKHIRDILAYSGFDKLFVIEAADD